MKTHLRGLVLLLLASPAFGSPLTFNDPTRPNVLREFDLITRTNIVGNGTHSGVNNSIGGRIAANDGTGWNDESDPLDAGESVTHSWTLAGPRSIGTYTVSFGTRPDNLLVEYFNGSWQTWDSFNAPSDGLFVRDPANVVATAVRYTATNTGTQLGQRLRLNELQVHLDGVAAVPTKSGYNWFTDSSRVSSTASSADGNQWDSLGGGNADTLRNNNLTNGDELKSQNANSDRAFVRYSFNDPAWMGFGVFGGRNGQGWENFEVYTANGTLPATQALATSNTASIVSAGWTAQHAKGTGIVGDTSPYQFGFQQPGVWDHMLIVFDTQFGAMNELEIYVPEPASLGITASGFALLAFCRRRRK